MKVSNFLIRGNFPFVVVVFLLLIFNLMKCDLLIDNQEDVLTIDIISIIAYPPAIALHDTAIVECILRNDDSLSYVMEWDCSSGEIIDSGLQVLWVPPNNLGTFWIYCSIRYLESEITSDSTEIRVFDDKQLLLNQISYLVDSLYSNVGKFYFDQYRDLLDEISSEKYEVIPLCQYKDYSNEQKVIVGLRHDIDHHPFKAVELAQIESEYGFNASYYILPSAEYYGHWYKGKIYRYSAMIYLYNELIDLGHEIGVHNDLISLMVLYGIDPLIFQQEELSYYQENDITIYGTSSHGSAIVREMHLRNLHIFSDFHDYAIVTYKGNDYEIGKYSLAEFGFEYEAYNVGYNIYLSDAGGTWNVDDFDAVLDRLRLSTPGDRIVILAHPCWWK